MTQAPVEDTSVRVTLLEFDVHGIPQPEGSLKPIIDWVRRTCRIVHDSGPALRQWRKDVAGEAAFRMIGRQLFKGEDVALDITCHFTLPRPDSRPKKWWMPNKKPDLDKLNRAVGDAMTGVVYLDDNLVTDWHTRKRYPGQLGGAAQPGAHIIVRMHVF